MTKNNKRTQDMSVEEILKSIREIISRHENEKPENDDVLELTDIVDETNKSSKITEGYKEQDYLVDEAAIEEASDSLKQFAEKAQLASKDIRKPKNLTVEEMVAQMMRPQLKEWLDKNLPILVKELVEKEIKRLIPDINEEE